MTMVAIEFEIRPCKKKFFRKFRVGVLFVLCPLIFLITRNFIYSIQANGSITKITTLSSRLDDAPTIILEQKSTSSTTTTTYQYQHEDNSKDTTTTTTTTSSSSLSILSSLPPVYPKIDLETCSIIRKNQTLLERYNQSLLLYPQTSTIPWPNVSTLAFYERKFYSGFRNQMMCFSMLTIFATKENYGQIMLETISQKDTYGSNKQITFQVLWDVEHWNSYYPKLPRLVHWDPIVFDQYDLQSGWYRKASDAHGGELKWTNVDGEILNTPGPTRPTPHSKQHYLLGAYMRYAQGKGPFTENGHRHQVEILMLKEALRPHPALRDLIQEKLSLMVEETTTKNDDDNNDGKKHKDAAAADAVTTTQKDGDHTRIEYITLHARVEPDMQKHPVCRDKKVLNLTDIFEMIETKWKDPPAPHLFLPINRQYIEQEGDLTNPTIMELYKNDPSKVNWIAVGNLEALNRASREGLWGGRVKVFEFGANMLKGTRWENRPSTTGALLNFFLSIEAKIFIGTEVSSYSHDVLATRFYRNSMENYKYLPGGLVEWTPEGTADPPGFGC